MANYKHNWVKIKNKYDLWSVKNPDKSMADFCNKEDIKYNTAIRYLRAKNKTKIQQNYVESYEQKRDLEVKKQAELEGLDDAKILTTMKKMLISNISDAYKFIQQNKTNGYKNITEATRSMVESQKVYLQILEQTGGIKEDIEQSEGVNNLFMMVFGNTQQTKNIPA